MAQGEGHPGVKPDLHLRRFYHGYYHLRPAHHRPAVLRRISGPGQEPPCAHPGVRSLPRRAHLRPQADFNKILDAAISEKLQKYKPASAVHSASTGKPIVAENALDLVKVALSEMLQKPVRWDHLLEETVTQMTSNKLPAKIFAIGISNVANSLVLCAEGRRQV